ncbi:MAG: hypothetical protein MZV64_42605 [Ignavibacteriales bacterium]|nr:hypothetical protein [Ignavibacteriales bacterium]
MTAGDRPGHRGDDGQRDVAAAAAGDPQSRQPANLTQALESDGGRLDRVRRPCRRARHPRPRARADAHPARRRPRDQRPPRRARARRSWIRSSSTASRSRAGRARWPTARTRSAA